MNITNNYVREPTKCYMFEQNNAYLLKIKYCLILLYLADMAIWEDMLKCV